MKHLKEGWDPIFVGSHILFVFRPGPDYKHDQIYGGGQLTKTDYNHDFEMSL